MADNLTLSGGTSKRSFDPTGILDKALDFGTQIGVAAYNSHNARKAAERQIEATKELMALQYQYNKWAYQYQQTKGPSLYRQGLTDAGYNPILPFTGGSGLTNASFGATGQGSAALENPALVDGNSVNSARLVSLQQKQIKSQIQNTNANTELQTEQAENERLHQDLNILDKAKRTIENEYLPDKLKSEIKEKFANATAAIGNMISNRISATASVVNANANMKKADLYGQEILNQFELGSDKLTQEMDIAIMNKQYDIVKGVVNSAIALYGIGRAKSVIQPLIQKYGTKDLEKAVGSRLFEAVMKGQY